MELRETVERIADIRHAKPSAATRQRVQEAAQELSRAGDMQLRVELANEALAALVALLYQADSDGQPANIDPVTWRVLLPCPWGSSGWRQWGLRSYEAEVLRYVLRVRSDARRHVNLFDYNEQSRTWHVNIADYPTAKDALQYLKQQPVTLREWRQQSAAYRTRMLKAQNKRRGV